MQYFPPALENLVEQFARLPGVGVKSAQRLAFHVLSLPEEDAAAFAQAILSAKSAIHCCPVCHRFRGGKGLATFGGLVIYCGLKYVPIVLCAGWAVMWVFDCTVMFPITVGIALPLLMYLFGEAPAKIITAICAGAVLDVMHIGNMKKALAGDEIMHVRGYFSEKLHKER